MTLPGYLDRWVLSERLPYIPSRMKDDVGNDPRRSGSVYSGSVFLHRMTGPDEPVLHTHPFRFRTNILEGGYVERYATPPGDIFREPYEDADGWDYEVELNSRVYWAGHSGEFPVGGAHYISELTANETWTLVVTGPKLGSWGFYWNGRYYPHWEYLSEHSKRPEPILRHGYKVEQ